MDTSPLTDTVKEEDILKSSESDSIKLGKLLRSDDFSGALFNGAVVDECEGNNNTKEEEGVQRKFKAYPAYGWGQNLTEISLFFMVS